MSEPTQYIIFVNGANIGTVKTISEANAIVSAYVCRNYQSGPKRIEVKDSKTYQVVSSWNM